MRVKVGARWYEARPGAPLMVELTVADKRRIANMAVVETRYAEFPDGSDWSVDDRAAWMRDVKRLSAAEVEAERAAEADEADPGSESEAGEEHGHGQADVQGPETAEAEGLRPAGAQVPDP